jgi:hypothetical protein
VARVVQGVENFFKTRKSSIGLAKIKLVLTKMKDPNGWSFVNHQVNDASTINKSRLWSQSQHWIYSFWK